MKDRIRWIRLLLVAVLGLALVLSAACSGKQAKPEPGTGTPAKEPVKIQFWDMSWGDAVKKAELDMIAEWNSKNPDIQVEYTQLGWGEYQQKLVGAVKAGNPPDITGGDSGIAFFFHAMGETEPIDDVIEVLKKSGDLADAIPWAYDKWKVDGKYIGFTWGIDARAFYYRTDIFKEKGIKVPTNWDELLAAAKALNDPANDFHGIVFPGKAGSYDPDQFFMTLAMQAGGGLADINGKPMINSPQNLQALRFELELAKYAPKGVTGYTFDEAHRLYQQGKAAMIFNGGWFINQMKTEAPEIFAKTDVMPVLKGPAGKQVMIGFYNPWMIFKGSKNKEAAKKFFAFAVSKQQLSRIYKENLGGTWPVYKSVANDPMYSNPAMLKNLALSVNEYAVDYWYPNNKAATGIAAVGTGITDFIVNPALVGTMTPEQALKNGADKLEKNFQ
ncbi:MAG TPA: sugar ABC transporter substrate-binding protein [Symbiobacteriaceae bacterium]|nr:sugar ABC transporter substrate-binding protein [Symbiobacteriaceae bacterium]